MNRIEKKSNQEKVHLKSRIANLNKELVKLENPNQQQLTELQAVNMIQRAVRRRHIHNVLKRMHDIDQKLSRHLGPGKQMELAAKRELLLKKMSLLRLRLRVPGPKGRLQAHQPPFVGQGARKGPYKGKGSFCNGDHRVHGNSDMTHPNGKGGKGKCFGKGINGKGKGRHGIQR
mmetsp:Transcript_7296/g.8682  ORF Transcript_7296/g.8682 Transcript_7296/m.8682 type:complete len:174 (-) Transcript_7296:98-619(-)